MIHCTSSLTHMSLCCMALAKIPMSATTTSMLKAARREMYFASVIAGTAAK